jgi:hypothetical protein
LELARARGARAVFVVGTAKGVGKTTALRAIYDAACAANLSVGLASVGYRARFPLRAGTLFATARTLLPATPAVEILQIAPLETSAGALLYARTLHDGSYDVIGPSTASGVRESLAFLGADSDVVLLDGAIDRLAMLASSPGAIVVSCGAAGAKSQPQAVEDVAALAARLRVRAADPTADALEIVGAFTATAADELMRRGERRQIVVTDPTQIALNGAALARALAGLRVRCRRPLEVVAATVCALAPERNFEPESFLRAVAQATGLPSFDVCAGREAA